jgi:hypothetical protein
VPKRPCTSGAEWRLQTGRPAAALSKHYRLECDYGTAVITIWQQGGAEPIYVCDSHAKQLGDSCEHGPEVRIVTPTSDSAGLSAFAASSEPSNTLAASAIAPMEEVRVIAPPAAHTNLPQVAASSGAPGTAGASSVAVAEQPRVLASQPDHPYLPKVAASSSAPGTAAVDEVPVLASKPNPASVSKLSASPNASNGSALASKIAPPETEPSLKPPVRDLTYGDSAKAMVDEAIWNMQPGDYEIYRAALHQGKSADEAARAAGGQLAVIHRKIADYSAKLQAVLSASKRTVNVEQTIDKPLEQMVLDIIGDEKTTDSAKDAFIQQLGTLQEWVKDGLRGDITPIQANRIMFAIGDRLNWGGATSVAEEMRPVYRALYTQLKTAIVAVVPQTLNLHNRLTNLYAAKSDLDHAISALRSTTLV